ncbi:MAG: CvpA family protein [Alphaproteobacteria bacterium]|nr:CvpA family protein [Alphaproteobacteria bacterium]
MFDLTTLDYIYVGVILASTIWATIRGGIYETVATLSWVVAAITARFVSPFLDGLLQSWFNLTDSTVGTLVASYFVVFFAILLIVGFINQKLRDKIQESIMNVTDHTLGVIFGIIRGVVVMGLVYWAMLWYYSDTPMMPKWISDARTRPLMQLTALKLDQWFIPGEENRLLQRDITGTREAMEIYNNLINPAVAPSTKDTKPADTTPAKTQKASDKSDKPAAAAKPAKPAPAPAPQAEEVGYKTTERTALENQLLQIKTVADAIEEREATRQTEGKK